MAGIFSAGVASLLAVPVVRFVSDSFQENTETEWHVVTDLSTMEPEETVLAPFNKVQQDGWMTNVVQDAVFVRKTKDGKCMVFDPHCTHLGCAVAWNAEDKQFQCPCHGGKYDENGNRVSGPPPRPLRQYEVKVSKNLVSIGKLKA